MNEIKIKLVEISSKNLFELSEANKETKKNFYKDKSVLLATGTSNELKGIMEIEFQQEDLNDLKNLFDKILNQRKMTIKIF